jgi:succinate dehydrogenase / fumarate reductase, flavoprotein subunit
MQDMEFYQFHPTGIVGHRDPPVRGGRGEGGYLLNNDGFRFMERYAPKLMELAPRDMVSRAIYQEVRAGRGIDGKDYVYLDVRHLGRKVIEEKLPDITDFARVYQGVEPLTEPVPIQPTAHYAMGGIPTDIVTRVVRDAANTVVPGLYAAGEAACVSVHGANRLGTNSLVDLLVFGRRAGRQMAQDVRGVEMPASPAMPPTRSGPRSRRSAAAGRRSRRASANELADVMMDDVGVYRDEATLRRGAGRSVGELRALRAQVGVQDKRHGVQHGPPRGARARLPARLRGDDGRPPRWPARRAAAPCREDFPERDDANFLTHTLAYRRRAARR